MKGDTRSLDCSSYIECSEQEVGLLGFSIDIRPAEATVGHAKIGVLQPTPAEHIGCLPPYPAQSRSHNSLHPASYAVLRLNACIPRKTPLTKCRMRFILWSSNTGHRKFTLEEHYMGIVLNYCQYGVLYLGSYYNTGPYIDFPHFGNSNLGKLPHTTSKAPQSTITCSKEALPESEFGNTP